MFLLDEDKPLPLGRSEPRAEPPGLKLILLLPPGRKPPPGLNEGLGLSEEDIFFLPVIGCVLTAAVVT